MIVVSSILLSNGNLEPTENCVSLFASCACERNAIKSKILKTNFREKRVSVCRRHRQKHDIVLLLNHSARQDSTPFKAI